MEVQSNKIKHVSSNTVLNAMFIIWTHSQQYCAVVLITCYYKHNHKHFDIVCYKNVIFVRITYIITNIILCLACDLCWPYVSISGIPYASISMVDLSVSELYADMASGKHIQSQDFRYVIFKHYFSDLWLRHLLRNCPHMKATGPYWW